MHIRTRMCISLDGCVTTPDGLPAQLADPAFTPGESYRTWSRPSVPAADTGLTLESEHALPGGAVEIAYAVRPV